MPVISLFARIMMNDQFYSAGLQPTSLYNIEYTPKLITRKTTAYANTKRKIPDPDGMTEKIKINMYNKIIINNFDVNISETTEKTGIFQGAYRSKIVNKAIIYL